MQIFSIELYNLNYFSNPVYNVSAKNLESKQVKGNCCMVMERRDTDENFFRWLYWQSVSINCVLNWHLCNDRFLGSFPPLQELSTFKLAQDFQNSVKAFELFLLVTWCSYRNYSFQMDQGLDISSCKYICTHLHFSYRYYNFRYN